MGRERWTFTVELPAGVPNPGRFVARLLKHLLRSWGVRCVAVLEDKSCGTAGHSDKGDGNS